MPLFEYISKDKYDNVLTCLNAQVKTYQKDETIGGLQEPIKNAGIILSGKVSISFFSKAGREYNVQQFGKGEMFGEAFACVQDESNTAQIVAEQKSQILLLHFSKLFTEKARSCPFASQVTSNLLNETAKKNIFLNKKIEILTQKKIRDRILIYLQTIDQPASPIYIPFNRQGLANYLGVDRSALSRELCTMRDEGILEFNKNRITLLKSYLSHL